MIVTTYDDPDDESDGKNTKEKIPESEIKDTLPLKKKRIYLAVAEVAARKVLQDKNLYKESYDMRSVHTYDLNFRVKYWDKSKLVHNVLVKMNPDYSVRETVLDH